ncbi:hypothetical protein HJG60_009661 [Phyllostomus discolor]|uniref:Uncharacterized protein n=1 Tax=Phyllostomus discolor TaxID=89673 RepID=A0A834B972_9CHIR|nr:hypothetical protein HJG60_009661 [Phyllostomus discolor]
MHTTSATFPLPWSLLPSLSWTPETNLWFQVSPILTPGLSLQLPPGRRDAHHVSPSVPAQPPNWLSLPLTDFSPVSKENPGVLSASLPSLTAQPPLCHFSCPWYPRGFNPSAPVPLHPIQNLLKR